MKKQNNRTGVSGVTRIKPSNVFEDEYVTGGTGSHKADQDGTARMKQFSTKQYG